MQCVMRFDANSPAMWLALTLKLGQYFSLSVTKCHASVIIPVSLLNFALYYRFTGAKYRPIISEGNRNVESVRYKDLVYASNTMK